MSEWLDGQKKPICNYRYSLQEKIKKPYTLCKLIAEEKIRLANLEAIDHK